MFIDLIYRFTHVRNILKHHIIMLLPFNGRFHKLKSKLKFNLVTNIDKFLLLLYIFIKIYLTRYWNNHIISQIILNELVYDEMFILHVKIACFE